MKQLWMAAGLVALSAASAHAQINVDLGIGAPRPVYVEPRPVYVEPRPVYVEPRPYYTTYGRDKHSRPYDYDYWNHRDNDRHDDRDDRHDNGRR